MSVVGGSPPNAAITHLSRLRTYAAANILEPIDLPFLAQYGVTENDFLPAVWQRAQFNGKLYAIPLDTHPFVMYYNVDVCRKAGLLDSDNNLKPLQGPEALTDAFLRAQKVTAMLGSPSLCRTQPYGVSSTDSTNSSAAMCSRPTARSSS